jgi:hypothetical protein
MSRISLLGLLTAVALVGGACSDDASSSSVTGLTVRDTLGNAFSVSITGGFYGLNANDPNLKPLSCESEYGATDVFALVWGSQILRVHAIQIPVSGYISFNPAEPGRPVACATDADCAPGLFSPPFSCQFGLCQYFSASAPLQTIDVIVLCQADIPWPTTCPYITHPLFAQRMAEVAAACGSATACANVPADCMQPIPAAPGLDASAVPPIAPVDAEASSMDGGS